MLVILKLKYRSPSDVNENDLRHSHNLSLSDGDAI